MFSLSPSFFPSPSLFFFFFFKLGSYFRSTVKHFKGNLTACVYLSILFLKEIYYCSSGSGNLTLQHDHNNCMHPCASFAANEQDVCFNLIR